MNGNFSEDSDFDLLKNKRKPSKEGKRNSSEKEEVGKKKLRVGENKR